MKKLLVCPKESGNTYDVCTYVSDNSDFEIKAINKDSNVGLEDCDVVVLSSGVYGGHAHKNILRWIENLQSDKINKNTKFFTLLTWFGRSNSDECAIKEIKELLAKKGIKLEDDYVECYGKGMGFVRSSHPDENDKEKVLSWLKCL